MARRGLGDFSQERVSERRLAGRGAARDENVGAVPDGSPQHVGVRLGHDARGDVIPEREHRDRRLADREAGRCGDWRQQPLEPLARFGQLGRDAWATGVDLGSDMVRDQAHDPLAISGRQVLAGIRQPRTEPVHPQATVGIEHHLDHGGVGE